jgi:hypothetical protein
MKKCIRCGKPGKEVFDVCADENQPRVVCPACDIALNALVLDFMLIPDRAVKMVHYIARKGKR